MGMTQMRGRLESRRGADEVVSVLLLGQQDHFRAEFEAFIAQVFARAYGAQLRHFMPWLLALQMPSGEPVSALGMRAAGDGALFLEQYLSRPIENVLAASLARPIDRAGVVEVGNLASVRGGGAQMLFLTLNAYLYGAGYEFVVFTATTQVRNSFARMGLPLTWLADADPACLGEAQQDWGSYYQQQPQVVVGNIRLGAAHLASKIEQTACLPETRRLWQAALLAGKQGRLSALSACLSCGLMTGDQHD